MKKTENQRGISLQCRPLPTQDNKSQRIGDILLAALAALVLISLGGTMLSLLDLGVYGIVLGVWAVVCIGVCFFFLRSPGYRKWILIGSAALCIVLALFGGDGFALALNAVKDLFGAAFSMIYLPSAVSAGCNEPLAATLFLLPVTMVFAAGVTYMLFSGSKVLYGILVLVLLLTLIPALMSPFWVWYVLLFYSLSLSIIAGISGIVKNSGSSPSLLSSAALIGAVLVVLCLIGGSVVGFDKPAALARWEASVAEDFNDLRYGRDTTSNFPEGDFNRLDSFVYTDGTALEITMSEPQSVYLRGFVGTEFSNTGWETTDKETLYEYADLFYWLHAENFFGTSQITSAAAAAGESTEAVSVSVDNIGAKDQYIYAPYELSDAAVGKAPSRIGDEALHAADYEDPAAVSYTMTSNLVRNAGDLAETLSRLGQSGDETALSYLENETAYRAFVYATALNIPESTETVLLSHFGEMDLSEGHADYDDAIQAIYDKLLVEITYNESCGTVPTDDDFLRYFLESSAEGYSVHYATAAALIFRYHGIPARYVEGYIVTPEDVEAAQGSTIVIDGGNAHAWVEYYRDGVGWIPLETTPPYLYIMEQPEEIQSLVSDTLNSNGLSGMLNMDEDNFEDIEEEEAELPEEDPVSPLVVVAIVFGSLLLLAAIAVLVLILRRRNALKKRRERIDTATPRLALDLLFRESLYMLFAAGVTFYNGTLDAYETTIREMDGTLGERYRMICVLHRESRFSDHPFPAERKKEFELFRDETEAFLRSRSSLRKRLWDQYIRHLY